MTRTIPRPAILPLVAAMVALWWLLAVLTAPTAEAQCPAPGGQQDALPSLQGEAGPGEVVFTGRGWGHGVGMSQYGAQGAAELGCSHTEILEHYYQGTRVADVDSSGPIDVGLLPDRPGGSRPSEVEVHAEGEIPWRFSGGDEVTQPGGSTWTVKVSGSRLALVDDDGETRREVPSATTLRAVHGRTVVQLPAKSLTGEERSRWTEGRPYRDGELRFRQRGEGMHVVARVPSLERYLRNVREIPASWPAAAVEAQAIAARSYAIDQRAGSRRCDGDCDLYDSTTSQVWYGYAYEAQSRHAGWVDAVEATQGRALTYDGQVVSGNYASSHGGHSESSAFVWGGSVSYLSAVDDSRWDLASANPHRGWSETFTAAELGRELAGAGHDVGDVLEVRTPDPRGASGRIGSPARGAGGVEFTGSRGVAVLTGDEVRSMLGLRSTLFAVDANLAADPCLAPPEAGEPEHVERLAGADRVATAVAVAETFEQADTVVLASSRAFPDALAGGALAADADAPMLLTPPDGLPEAVAEAIAELGAREVVVLGGEAALSGEVLDAAGAVDGVEDVRRVAGENRFATAAAIAAELEPTAEEVVLTLGQHATDEGRAWPDAVASGALLATGEARPLLLTRADELPEATLEALTELEADRVLLLGGTAAVSDEVERALEALGSEVERLAGEDRWETSVKVLGAALERGTEGDGAIFATGEAFPDALAAGALAGRTGWPVVLAPQCGLGDDPPLEAFLETRPVSLERGLALGGTAALSPLTVHELDLLLDP